MKILEKITLIIYSNLILIISAILCALVFKWIDMNSFGEWIGKMITGETSSRIILGFSIVFILLSIRCIFFDKTSKEQIKERQGVLLQNENGKLMISKDTIENIVSGVAKNYKESQEVTTSVEIDKENHVKVFANLVVADNSKIKDLSAKLQNEIKEKVKAATDLEVNEVNIKIKNAVGVEINNSELS